MTNAGSRVFSIIALVATITFSACSGDQPKSEETRDTASVSETAPAETRTFTAQGVVTKIDRERNLLTLDHGQIGDWMEPMTMPFKVNDPAMLDQVQVGDSVEFTLSVAGDQGTITEVKGR